MPIWHDQPGPNEEDTGLAERDLTIVHTDQTRSLRHKQKAAGRCVENVLGYLRGNLAWQVRSDARDQCSRNHRSSLHDVWRSGLSNTVEADRATVHRGVHKGKLAVLAVLRR